MSGSDCTTPCAGNCGNQGCPVSGALCLGICPTGYSGQQCQTGMNNAHVMLYFS